MRLGDLDALLERADEITFMGFQADERKKHFLDLISTMLQHCPTIDAVPVCRCWDCGHGLRCVDGYVRCSHPSGKVILMKSSDFCSYGERKEAEGDG